MMYKIYRKSRTNTFLIKAYIVYTVFKKYLRSTFNFHNFYFNPKSPILNSIQVFSVTNLSQLPVKYDFIVVTCFLCKKGLFLYSTGYAVINEML